MKSLKAIISLLFCTTTLLSAGELIQPQDLNYLGAFRLPDVSDVSEWIYSGYAMTFYPDGDPSNTDDYPGSIFALGHDHHQLVSEISIPNPVISGAKDPADLNVAETLQPFGDITGGVFGEQEIPRMGIEYLPAMGDLPEGLYYCRGEHFQDVLVPSHGYCNLDLGSPTPVGPWYYGNYSHYTTNDYLFAIPHEWADANTPGQYLASGRFRDGEWGGLGPALYAYTPVVHSTLPTAGDTLWNITPLLMFGEHQPGNPYLVASQDKKMNDYKEPDEWSGGAWLTGGDRSAVVLVGTKAMGDSWYGFSDGTVWPQDPPYPDVPEWPHDERGWWADSINAVILFFDPADLADVANGIKSPWEPQPYAMMNINEYMFSPGYDYGNYKMTTLGACCYDRSRGLLYINERRADEDKSIIHVFEITTPETGIGKHDQTPEQFELMQNYSNPFNPTTQINFSITKAEQIMINVFDIKGRMVKTLVNRHYQAGQYTITWDSTDYLGNKVASGVYFYNMNYGSISKNKKMILLR